MKTSKNTSTIALHMVLLTSVYLSGCTNKELYEATQDNRLRHCQQQAKTQPQYAECAAIYGISYEKYREITP